MKSKRVIVLFGILAAVVAYLVRQVRSAAATGLDQAQNRRLLAAIQAARASTMAAFDSNAPDASQAEARDQKAAADAGALCRAFEDLQPLLRPRIGPVVASFVETIAAAQLQIMAFAINRKNRGNPDATQIEAERNERAEFRQKAEPLVASLVQALS
ncbi:MAG: hypothetical protein ABI346_08755 [Candidatus Baltobacteraceae bacterium]